MLFSRVLGCAAFVIAGLTQPISAEQIGPSFDCSAARQPLAQILCADPDLSQTDLRFAQAYFALLPQLDDAGKRELKQEDLRFLDAVQQHCGIPPAGPAPAKSDALRKCVKDAYESQRSVWLLRLRPPFSEEASRPIEQHVALQRLLQQLGFLSADARVDGVYGAGTREAISRWQSAQARIITGVLGDAEAKSLEQQVSEVKTTKEANQPAPNQKSETLTDKPIERSPPPQRPSEPARSSSVGTTAAQLTDADPVHLVDRLLDRQSYESLLLGDIVVYGGGTPVGVEPPPGNSITVAQYSRYKQWTNIGLINIRSQGPMSQKMGLSWGQFLSMNRYGDQEKITVMPAQTANNDVESLSNILKIKMATFKTDNVVKKEERVMGVSKYDILMVTYTAEWTSTFRKFCQVNSACTLVDKGKFKVLLKFDEFTDRWNIVTWDSADMDHEFATQNVDQQVRSLQ